MRALPLPVASIVLCGCASTLNVDDALTTVPYDLLGSGRILIDVEINDDGPHPFALDTAASISSIFDELRQRLALEALPDAAANVRGIVASGQFPLVNIDRLQIGTEVWPHARIVTLPSTTDAADDAAGILGIDFLRRYGVGFFMQERVIRLYPPESIGNRAYRGWTAVPLEPLYFEPDSEPLYVIEIEIRGRALPAVFDLGSGLNVLSPPSAPYLRLVPVTATDDEALAGVIETAPVLARLEFAEVTTGDLVWQDEEFLIADLQIFSTLTDGDEPFAILGSALFNQRDFVIDFLRNRLLVRADMSELDASR